MKVTKRDSSCGHLIPSTSGANSITSSITGGVIVATGGLFWLDPGVALVISAVIAYQAVHLVGRVLAVLRSGS